MRKIIKDILARMQSAANGVHSLAVDTGFRGPDLAVDDILKHLANTSLDVERYAGLHADSAVLKMGLALVSEHGNADEKKKAESLALWDYDAP